MGSIALPLTNGFIGEYLLLNGLFQYSATLAAFAGLSIILGAVYMLRAYQAIMLGETNSITENFEPLVKSEKAVLIIISVAIIIFGIYPQPLLDISAPAVADLVQLLNR
jgi:NADH-quinone oxidoreductase subunit M